MELTEHIKDSKSWAEEIEPWPRIKDLSIRRFQSLSYRLVDEYGRVVFFSGELVRLNGNIFEIRDGQFRFEMGR